MKITNSLKTILLNHWKAKGGWINGGRGEEIAFAEGFKSSNASRRLRELCQEGLLERELRPMQSGGKSVWYRAINNGIIGSNEKSPQNSPQQSRPIVSGIGTEIKEILRDMRETKPSCPSLFS